MVIAKNEVLKQTKDWTKIWLTVDLNKVENVNVILWLAWLNFSLITWHLVFKAQLVKAPF